jgi:hypothetical protein
MKWQWVFFLLAAALFIIFLGSELPEPPVGRAEQISKIYPTPTMFRTLTPTPTPTPKGPPPVIPRVEMSIQPVIANRGELVTLSIRYVNLGVPYTYLAMNPPDLMAFEPPVTMPCKYRGNLSDCTTFTLRALATGEVSIGADVEGEIFDYSCHCWRYTWVNGGTRAVIAWKTYLFFPLIEAR